TIRLWNIGLLLALLLLPHLAAAQSLNLDMGNALPGGSASSKLLQLIALVTILSLAPSILVMVTSFTRIVVVLSFLRSALGLQQTPPNQVIISLALFLTAFIMAPVFEKSYTDGLVPLMNEKISEVDALPRIGAPFHAFMLHHVRPKDLKLFA